MDRQRLIQRINKIFEDRTLVCKIPVLYKDDFEIFGDTETLIKFKILGEKKMYWIGQEYDYVKISILVISSTHPMVNIFVEEKRLMDASNFIRGLEHFFSKTLDIFGIDKVVITEVEYL